MLNQWDWDEIITQKHKCEYEPEPWANSLSVHICQDPDDELKERILKQTLD